MCLKNIMYAKPAMPMYCKIIETILNKANFPLKKIKIKLGLYKRVTVTVKCEPSTGAD